MRRIFSHIIFYQVLIFIAIILSFNAANSVGVFSCDIDEETLQQELHARSKISAIISDRQTFNETLIIHLEKKRNASRQEKEDLIREINGITLASSASEVGLNTFYDAQIAAARKDKELYDLLEVELRKGSFEPAYKLLIVALAAIDATGHMRSIYDERVFVRRIKALAAPHVTLECRELCERVQWVGDRQGALLSISTVSNQVRYIKSLNRRFKEAKERMIQILTQAIPRDLERASYLISKADLLFGRIVEGLDEYTNLTELPPDLSTWVRGIEVLEDIEVSFKKNESLSAKLSALHSSPNALTGQEASQETKKKPSKKSRQRNLQTDIPTLPSSSAKDLLPPLPLIFLSSTAPAAVETGGPSSASASAELKLSSPLPSKTFPPSQEPAAAAAPIAHAINVPSSSEVKREQALPLASTTSKPKIIRESYAQRTARYKINRDNYFNMLRRAQPLEEMVTLTGSRIGNLESKPRETLQGFVTNKHFKYERTAFEAWIRQLGGYMKAVDGSQWRVTLFDESGDKLSASIHTPHGGRFDWLDPVSRSNLLFLFQQGGLIEWNR